MKILRGHGLHWAPVGHGNKQYEHGPGHLVIVDDEAAGPLCHNGGYHMACPADVEAEIRLLEERIAALRRIMQ